MFLTRRPLWTAGGFALAAVLVAGALGWITRMTLELEAGEAFARQRAIHEERIRVALWRMDAALAELLAEENRRPVTGYGEGQALAKSGQEGPIRARFELGASHPITVDRPLPQIDRLAALEPPPQPSPRGLPPPSHPASDRVARVEEMPDAERTVSPAELWARARKLPSPLPEAGKGTSKQAADTPFSQEALNAQAFDQRQDLARQNTLVVEPPPAPSGAGGAASAGPSPPPGEPRETTLAVLPPALGSALASGAPAKVQPASVPSIETPFEPRWLDDELVLVRLVATAQERRLQGTWLDLPALSGWLLGQVSDLVPVASLGRSEGEPDPGRQLALLPLTLVVAAPVPIARPEWTPARLGLAAAWLATLLALLGVGALLAGSVRLAERRAAFVSAVTHELRTPLTTFKLYTDLLAESAGTSEERAGWLSTLRREASRLGYLVDNVLAFSRLESRGRSLKGQAQPLAALLERIVPRLTERADQAGFRLEIEAPSGLASLAVVAEAGGLEQILFNLVDNACKYAETAVDRRLHLEVEEKGRRLILRVKDHGPGLVPELRRRIFRPFHRSAAQAAGSAPGVGLGLALSRRLARQMGGELRWVEEAEGAVFELALRRSR